jgi:hypothetical protein
MDEESPVQKSLAFIPSECEGSAVHPSPPHAAGKATAHTGPEGQISRYARNDTIYVHLHDLVGANG